MNFTIMGAQYYNPDIKRFINQDVLQGSISIDNGQSMNRYDYVNGNPISQVDSFGLCAESTNSNSWMHYVLGGISFIPRLNVPASLLDFGLYLKEGDHVNAGIALACIVPFAKEGVLGVRVAEAVLEDGSKIIKAADEAGVIAKGAGKAVQNGDFSIINWEKYPNELPKPDGPFRLIDGDEYDAARRAANRTNQALHSADPSLKGLQIHEIHPVKFGGSPTDITNKIPLTLSEHAKATTWWRRLQRELEK